MLGWHYIQVQDWATAKRWFEKSLMLMGSKNVLAWSYLKIIEQKMTPPRTAQVDPPARSPIASNP
jgi:hypothetical protein